MKRTSIPIFLGMLAILASTLACGGSFSTANIGDAWMASDENGNNHTTVFSQDAVFYALVELKNAPDETTLKAVWTVVDAENTEKNLVINETEATSGDGVLTFHLENTDYLWPIGKYKVDFYLNGTLDTTLEFEVQ